ncbi:MAG: hypothetical protein IJV39_04930 [Ruminococcus sp.]|nr:hypothetical protein [Ruminococcus sp.]
MSYDINTVTADCYEGTLCLINKFGVSDETALAQLEADITFAKSAELENTPINGYNINFSEIDTDLLMIATIQSAQGVTNNLKRIFEKSIKTV